MPAGVNVRRSQVLYRAAQVKAGYSREQQYSTLSASTVDHERVSYWRGSHMNAVLAVDGAVDGAEIKLANINIMSE